MPEQAIVKLLIVAGHRQGELTVLREENQRLKARAEELEVRLQAGSRSSHRREQ